MCPKTFHKNKAEQRREQREGKTDAKRVKEAPQGLFEGRREDQLHVQGKSTGLRCGKYYDNSKIMETVIDIRHVGWREMGSSRESTILEKKN